METKTIKLSDIEINETQTLVTWREKKVVTNNIDSIINDFEFLNCNVAWELPIESTVEEYGLDNLKVLLLNAHICGVLSAITPDSMFNKHHKLGDDEKKEVEEQETEDFSKSLEL